MPKRPQWGNFKPLVLDEIHAAGNNGELGGRSETVQKIRAALNSSGIEFIEKNGGGPGVRLRK
jgi:hypothetical protein